MVCVEKWICFKTVSNTVSKFVRNLKPYNMAAIKAILVVDKRSEKGVKNEDQEHPIFVRLHDKQSRKYYSVGRKVRKSDWDEKTGLVKKTNSNYIIINAIIRKEIRRVESDMLTIMATENNPDVVSELRKKERKVVLSNFFTVADGYVSNQRKMKKFNQEEANKPRVKHLREFNGSGTLKFADITPAYLKRFQVYLKEQGNGDRTVANHLVLIRTVYNIAIREGVADKNLYPFGIGKIIVRFPESQKVGLNEEEVRLMEEAEFTPAEKNLDFARDVWMFTFYLAGIRSSDALNLKWKDCTDNRITYVMGKNSKVVSLKLPEKAVAILKKHDRKDAGYEDYIFGVFDELDEKDEERKYKAMRKQADAINTDLKKVAQKLGIKKKVSFHISRHTFGNITGDKISPQMLQKLYRHTDIKTTMGYQSNFIHKDVDDALESVLKF